MLKKLFKFTTILLIGTVTFTAIHCATMSPVQFSNAKVIIGNAPKYLRKKVAGDGEGSDSSLSPGQAGSLNLLLLSDPKVHAYVKDWFGIAGDVENGKANSYKTHVTAENIYSLALTETSTYDGTYIPKSHLNVKLPGRKAGKEYNSQSPQGKFNLKECNIGALAGSDWFFNIAATYGGRDVGPFQQQRNFFDSTPPHKLYNYNGSSSGRKASSAFLPDEMNGVDMIFQPMASDKNVTDLKLTSAMKWVLLETAHNGGSGVVWREIFGDSGSVPKDKRQKSFEGLTNDICNPKVMEWAIAMEKKGISTGSYRTFAVMAMVKLGWKFPPSFCQSYTTSEGVYYTITGSEFKQIYPIIFGGSPPSVDSFIAKYKSNPTIKDGARADANRHKAMWKDYGGCGSWFPVITLSNIILGTTTGRINYGKLLKSMGLNVDPTNPSTYITGSSGGTSSGNNTSNSTSYQPSTSTFVTKPTGKGYNVIEYSNPGYSLKKGQGLASYYCKNSVAVPKVWDATGDTKSWSKISSYGEKDGFPLFPQSQYYANGVKQGPHYLPGTGCGIFSLASTLHAIGWGNIKNPGLSKHVQDCIKQFGTDGYITPYALDCYITPRWNWYVPGIGMTDALPKIIQNMGIPCKPIWWNRDKTKDLNETIADLKKGFPVIASFDGGSMDFYKIDDLEKRKVSKIATDRITKHGHYITMYSYDEYTTSDGKKIRGISMVDSGNYGKNWGGKGLNTNEVIVDLDSMYPIKSKAIACSSIQLPVKAMSPSSSSTGDADDDGDGHYIEDDFFLDDSAVLESKYVDGLATVKPVNNTTGIIDTFGKDVDKINIFIGKDAKISQGGKVLTYTESGSPYKYELKVSSGQFRNIKLGKWNKIQDIRSDTGGDIEVRKCYTNGSSTEYVPITQMIN